MMYIIEMVGFYLGQKQEHPSNVNTGYVDTL